MSQPQRPHEQIPYPTGPEQAPLPPGWPDGSWTSDQPSGGVPWTPDQPSTAAPPAPAPAPAPARAVRNPWKWVAAGLAVLLAVVLAAVAGRLSAPSQQAAQPAPSRSAPSDPGAPGAQGPLFTPEPSPGHGTYTPVPGSPPTFYSGQGNAVVTITKDPGPAIVAFECDKCTGNTVLKSDGHDSVLVNAVGAYSGRRPIDLQPGGITTTITVGASDSWRMTVSSGLTAARASVEGAPLTGQGDDVLIMNGTSTTAHVTNTGGAGFIVYVVPVRSATVSVAVNTVGTYDGTVALPAPAVVIVQSTGSWSIAPS
jgi:hypothetical protein